MQKKLFLKSKDSFSTTKTILCTAKVLKMLKVLYGTIDANK